MTRTISILAALFLFVAAGHSADKPAAAAAPAPNDKLLGGWQGGACQGTWIFHADGTFKANSYTPGNNRLAGTWQLKTDTVPPTLIRTCKTSDDADMVGRTWEVKVRLLDEKEMHYAHSGDGPYPDRLTRLTADELTKQEAYESARETELAALQGTWTPLAYEEAGQKVAGVPATRHVIKGDRLAVQVDGRTVDTGHVVFDPLESPKRLYLHMHSGTTHAIIYARAGDHLIYCGNRKERPVPTDFATGTKKGGEYLIAWKIEH